MNRLSLLAVCLSTVPLLASCDRRSKEDTRNAPTRSLGFAPSNVDLAGMDLTGIGDFVVDDPTCTVSTDEYLASCGNGADVLKFKLFKQVDGSSVAVYVARNIRIGAGGVLTAAGKNPLVLVALDTMEIRGGLVAAATPGGVAGAGGHAQETVNTRGAGPGGGGAGNLLTSAGGGSYCGQGGGGAVGRGKTGGAARGGAPYGSATITPLVGGSSGGMGGVGEAGGGGGALQLVAGDSVKVLGGGYVHTGGGGGSFGGQPGQEAAGGGSGGSILIEAQIVTVAGTLATNGGGGGSSSASGGTPTGDDATRDDRPASAGKGVPAGGRGAAAALVNGGDGAGPTEHSSGAGGGGAGRIRINTKTGQAMMAGATVSPGVSTPCTTQGKVRTPA